MRKTEPMAEGRPREPSRSHPTFRDIAREEFWIVAKAFFAPVYGTYLVWRQLLSLTQKVDGEALGAAAPQPPSQPAE